MKRLLLILGILGAFTILAYSQTYTYKIDSKYTTISEGSHITSDMQGYIYWSIENDSFILESDEFTTVLIVYNVKDIKKYKKDKSTLLYCKGFTSERKYLDFIITIYEESNLMLFTIISNNYLITIESYLIRIDK